jgi:hypothetical protein
MLKAELRQGRIQPEEPLPADWPDGTKLIVDRAEPDEPSDDPEAIERWYQELEEAVADCDPNDIKKLQDVLDESRMVQKELMRRKMGLVVVTTDLDFQWVPGLRTENWSDSP